MTFNGLKFLEGEISVLGIRMPVRTTLIELGQNRIMLSPGSPFSPETLKSVGPVTDLVAPSLLHGTGVPKATGVFPEARVWGPRGMAQKKPEVKWTHDLNVTSWHYQQELPLIPIEGAPIAKESVFFHPVTKTLIVTDLVFNILNPKGIGAWIGLHLFGTYGRFAMSRLFLKAIKDKEKFEKSLEQVFQYDFENLVMAHGDVIVGGARDRLRTLLREKGFRVP